MTRAEYRAFLKKKKNDSLKSINMTLGIAVMRGNYNAAEKIQKMLNRLRNT